MANAKVPKLCSSTVKDHIVVVVSSEARDGSQAFGQQVTKLATALQEQGRHLTVIDVNNANTLPITFMFQNGAPVHILRDTVAPMELVAAAETAFRGGGRRRRRRRRRKRTSSVASSSSASSLASSVASSAASSGRHSVADAVQTAAAAPQSSSRKDNVSVAKHTIMRAIASLQDGREWTPDKAFVSDVVARAETADGSVFEGSGTAAKVFMYALLVNKVTRQHLALRGEVLQATQKSMNATHLKPIETADHFGQFTTGMEHSKSLRNIFIEHLQFQPVEMDKTVGLAAEE
jgi:hypothetical protein